MAIRTRFARPVKRLAVHKFGSSSAPPLAWLDHSKSLEERDRLKEFFAARLHIPPVNWSSIPRIRNPKGMQGEFAVGVVYWRPDLTYGSWLLQGLDLNDPESYKFLGVTYKWHQAWDKVITASEWHISAATGIIEYLGDAAPLRFASNPVKGLLEHPKKW